VGHGLFAVATILVDLVPVMRYRFDGPILHGRGVVDQELLERKVQRDRGEGLG
jgi:hypothetical protein